MVVSLAFKVVHKLALIEIKNFMLRGALKKWSNYLLYISIFSRYLVFVIHYINFITYLFWGLHCTYERWGLTKCAKLNFTSYKTAKLLGMKMSITLLRRWGWTFRRIPKWDDRTGPRRPKCPEIIFKILIWFWKPDHWVWYSNGIGIPDWNSDGRTNHMTK